MSHFTVLYFAQVAELTGTRQESWPINGALIVEDWLSQLLQKHPQLEPLKARLKVAVNQHYVKRDHAIHAGNEVAVFEPVTGG